MKAYYDSKPSKYEAVGDGSYRYRYDIQEVEQTAQTNATDDSTAAEETRTQWVCEEVTIWAPVTSRKLTQAVIAGKWDKDHEQKLVNEYNGALLGVYGSKTSEEAKAKIANYTAFLTERAALKTAIDADCEELHIR